MDSQLLKVLTNLGLNEKEAKVFLALTEQGTAVVSSISQSAGINRVTTYDVLEKLKQRGLVSFFTKNKVKYFTGIDPEILLEEFEKRTNDLRVHLPKFKTLTGEISHPRVRYFEGIDGIKAIYADTLNTKSDILNFSNSSEIRKKWPNYDNEYVEKRAKKNIFLRGICPKDKAGETVHAEDEKYHRETRLVNPEQFNFTNEINIYDDKVAIISFKDELIGMIIESSEIANSQRAIFNMCWQCANSIISEEDLKKKMLSPIKHSEIKETTTSEVIEKKILKDNLSLF
jgi:HTH-type transcriptional regulator, sugar sensing transcriptional regulator